MSFDKVSCNSVYCDKMCIRDSLLLIGATGTGKTNALLHMITQLKRGMGAQDVMLVFDAKMDYEQFHVPGDSVISNWPGAQSVKWNIFTDIVCDGWDEGAVFAGADEIAEVIFSQAISTSSQPFFPSCARDIFSAVLKAMCLLGAQESSFRDRYLNNRAPVSYTHLLLKNGTESDNKGVRQNSNPQTEAKGGRNTHGTYLQALRRQR